PVMQKNLRFRNDMVMAIRDYLSQQEFIEVETPMLTKSTPEGARDYLVPSRVHPGPFYALPQSPQIFKQLLMAGGVDRYYQVARCFRDEDLRADRQPEFTQVDVEMSFTSQEGILQLMEGLVRYVFDKMLHITFEQPFPRLTWREAMDRYGSDKPDLRFGLPIVDVSSLVKTCGFAVFRKVVDGGGAVRAINVPGGASFTRTVIEDLTNRAIGFGAKGMAWISIREDGELYSILTKYFSKEELDRIVQAVDAKPGDFILFCADQIPVICRTLGGLRLEIADLLGLRRKDDFQCLFVTDFPQFEYSEEEKRFVAMHHPFTMPYEEDIPYLLSDPARVRARAYDIILNGVELGGGSIRIHRTDIQQKMFEALGFSDQEIQRRFGFMVNAFRYGTPPHGGFALGLDRFVMLLLGLDSLREVIAFPKIRDASCLLTGAPDVVDEEQLAVLHLAMGEAAQGASGKKQARSLSQVDVDKVASLARLKVPPKEKAALAKEMGAIIEFANQLGAIDTGDVPITAHIIPVENVFREDREEPSYPREALLKNVPSKEEGFLYVPKVVE
ncbi:MAG: aspartate--tRNA ligase, partial [Oscillospiraceae bacterium]|nr:aspartate--tRNA ligase [Oscillospiraceae bacterium]